MWSIKSSYATENDEIERDNEIRDVVWNVVIALTYVVKIGSFNEQKMMIYKNGFLSPLQRRNIEQTQRSVFRVYNRMSQKLVFLFQDRTL